jgi:hypothetical protein
MSYNAKKTTTSPDKVAGATRRTLRQVKVNVPLGKVGRNKVPNNSIKVPTLDRVPRIITTPIKSPRHRFIG